MKISASIVLFKNDREILLSAINSFLASSSSYDTHLYLIDNSPSNALKNISDDNRITYIFNPSNPGFGTAHNIAINLAFDFGSKYHLILNPDVYFEPNVIPELVRYLDLDEYIANIMPKVLYPNGENQYLCKVLPTPYDWIGRRFNPSKRMKTRRNNYFELRFTGYNKIMEVPYLSGCFMFLRVSSLKQVGLFDENIFMYGEETDLCRRLIDGGFKTIFYPYVHIYHHFGKGSHKSFKLTKIGIQSAIYYFNKWGWIVDKRRDEINAETLRKLEVEK
ncbi:conserved hypothetical protein [Moraxellaceae bacterium 17A]|nr:conserved hypothetical protein [Moraxellaceae bacterium 17A]